MRPAPSAAASVWLLTRLRLRRAFNMVFALQLRKPSTGKSRPASGGKKGNRWLFSLLIAAFMTFSLGSVARLSVLHLHCHLDAAATCLEAGRIAPSVEALDAAAATLSAAPFSTALATALTLQLLLLWMVALLLPLGSRELAHADWDLEWLVTLPLRRGALLWGRLLERTVTNLGGLLALLPACAMAAWYSGYRWAAPPLALAAALALLLLAALGRTVLDTGLRLSLPPSQLRNLQALASVACLPLMYLAMSFSMPGGGSFTLDWARAFPAWTLWTPPGLLLQTLNARGVAQAATPAALLAGQCALLLWAGVALLRHQLRDGVVASGTREAVRRARPAPAGDAAAGRWRIGSALQRRELRLLGRDRNFLVQSLLVPVVIVASQLFFTGQLDSLAALGENPQRMAAMAFGMGAYVLMLSAFQTLNTEGPALWMLYTFPRSLDSMLKEKAQLWGVLSLLYPLAVFAIGLAYAPRFDLRLLALFLTVLAGIPIYTLIAVSLGVFACDPLAQEAQARLRQAYVYLYLLLSSLYIFSLYAVDWTQTLAVIVLTASLALALWQKARDALPYLLDPSASPAARVSAADGLIAATLFYVLQGLLMLLFGGPRQAGMPGLVSAFAIAGAAVYLLARYVYWRAKTSGVPAVLAARLHGGAMAALRRAAGAGLAGGAVAVAAGLLYLALLRDSPWWPAAGAGPQLGIWWLLALSMVAAPLFEEFIFRGLIFGGLRRSMPLLPAMLASAAIFAIVHPPQAMLPVFVVGLCAAWAYERSKSLLAPMLAHALYNGAVIAVRLAL